MKRWYLVPVLALTLLVSACIITTSEDSSLTVVNESGYVLTELRVADYYDTYYGADLLGHDVLYPGEAIEIWLDCGTYDVLVVDEYGVECELIGLDVCFDDAVWVIEQIKNWLNTSDGNPTRG